VNLRRLIVTSGDGDALFPNYFGRTCFSNALRAEDGTVRGCFESERQTGCANITRSSQICYCDGDLCNLNRASSVSENNPSSSSSSALQWLNPSSYRCPLPICGGAADGHLPSPPADDSLRAVSEVLGEFKLRRPINVQLHFNYCDPKSLMVTMMLVMVLLVCLKFVLFVFHKLN